MSTRRLRARLDRLTPPAKSTIRGEDLLPFNFKIDPTLAKALRDDHKRAEELERKRSLFDEPTEEERTLLARIAERASAISCPAGYGFSDVLDDKARLDVLEPDSLALRWYGHLKLNNVEDPDALEAHLIARIEAFNQTPEGRARNRLEQLEMRRGWKSAADHNELISLLTLYPEPRVHPMHPLRNSIVAFRRSLEQRKRDAEEDRLALERANERHRRNNGKAQ